MRKTDMYGVIAGLLALITTVASALLEIEWMLIVAVLLMALCMVIAVSSAVKGKEKETEQPHE